MKFLLVDDSDIVIASVTKILEDAGHEVVSRCLGFGTGAAILRENPDVLLLDVAMPGIDGEAVLGCINEESLGKKRPVVLLYSGKSDEELRSIVERTGADGYIRKTGNEARLLNAISLWVPKVLDQRRRREPQG